MNKKINSIILEHKKFFKTGITKNVDFRKKQLIRLKDAIVKNKDIIMDALYKDLRKSEFEAYLTEIGILVENIKFTLKNIDSWAKVKKVKTPLTQFGAKSYIYKEPYGTVLIIGPFNYPFQLLFEPLIGAIAAGNCTILKPSEHTPNVSEVVEKIINENFDERYISVIKGDKEVTSALINSDLDYIFFTGSVKVGKIVMEAASRNLTPVTLELGGKSPCIVHKDANLNIAAERIFWGKFMNAGQTCVAPDYLLIHKEVKERFINKLKEVIIRFYGQNTKESKDLGRIINESQFNRLICLIDNEKVIFGGRYYLEDLFIEPTIMDNINWEDKVMEDEIFGPILPVIEYDDLDEIIENINSRPKPLAMYVFTENKEVEKRLLNEVSFGGGCINDTISHLATQYLPFGGVGNSGIGAYHGKYSFDTFSHRKSILKKTTKFSLKFILPPYNDKKLKLVKKILK